MYRYDVFGRTVVYDGDGRRPRPVSAVGNPYFFTGRRLDFETGLYYYRARMYSPNLGRFLQTDPIGYADGINWYAYCGNNPVVFVDPHGENAWGGFVSWWAGQGFDTSVDISTKDYIMDFIIPATAGSITEGGKGLAAGVDGWIPVYDPFSGIYANPDGSIDTVYLYSQLAGNVSRDAALWAGGIGLTQYAYNAAMGSKAAFGALTMGEQMALKTLLPGAIAKSAGITAAGCYLTANLGLKGISAWEYYDLYFNQIVGGNNTSTWTNNNGNFGFSSSSLK